MRGRWHYLIPSLPPSRVLTSREKPRIRACHQAVQQRGGGGTEFIEENTSNARARHGMVAHILILALGRLRWEDGEF